DRRRRRTRRRDRRRDRGRHHGWAVPRHARARHGELRMSVRAPMSLLALPILALAACSGPTQLVVVVDTNLDVPIEIDNVEVVVTGPSGVRTVAPQALVGADAPDFPLTLGVTPSGDALGPVDVIAVGTLDGVEI